MDMALGRVESCHNPHESLYDGLLCTLQGPWFRAPCDLLKLIDRVSIRGLYMSPESNYRIRSQGYTYSPSIRPVRPRFTCGSRRAPPGTTVVTGLASRLCDVLVEGPAHLAQPCRQ